MTGVQTARGAASAMRACIVALSSERSTVMSEIYIQVSDKVVRKMPTDIGPNIGTSGIASRLDKVVERCACGKPDIIHRRTLVARQAPKEAVEVTAACRNLKVVKAPPH